MKRMICLALLANIAVSSVSYANNIIAYQKILLGNRLTIKYESVIPLSRESNKNKVDIHGKSGMNLDNAHFVTNRQFEGIVVVDGDNKYEEITSNGISVCRLILDDKVYLYTKRFKDGKTTFYGNTGKGNVSASGRNLDAEFYNGVSYADPNLTKVLNALLPLDYLPAELPVYRFLQDGCLKDGTTFADFYTEENSKQEAIRYYFKNDNLTKISAVALNKEFGSTSFSKVLIKINLFNNLPQTEYLKLPAGLKDTTK